MENKTSMIINSKVIGWNWNISRKFWTSFEDFEIDKPWIITDIKNWYAIINGDTIECWDLRTTRIISFENREDKLLFLKKILW